MQEVYRRLARHLGPLVQGYPYTDELPALLEAGFSPTEAQAALAIPADLQPLEVAPLSAVCAASELPADETARALSALASRGQIFSRTHPGGEPGYALHQVGYGMPQAYFWGGDTGPEARRMAEAVRGYFRPEVTAEIYGGRPTKTFRYAPASLKVEAPKQGVLPGELMEPVLERAGLIAVCSCPCRVSARVLGRTDCPHSLEVCLKYDEMAEFVTGRGLGRAIGADEARAILMAAEEEGLVHMVDNATGGIKHTCNCCGCYCWNLGLIRRRKVARDDLMASYFIRATEEAACIGCGACADICPVEAVRLEGEVAVVDEDWCVGCGVCAGVCPAGAVGIQRRTDQTAPAHTGELFARLAAEGGAGEA
jgi:ferredoxin